MVSWDRRSGGGFVFSRVRTVGGSRLTFETGRRRDVEDGTALATLHAPDVEHGVSGEHEAVDVGAGHGLDVLDGEIGERGRGAEGEAGVVDEDVDVADFLDGFANRIFHLVVAGHVGGAVDEFSRVRLELPREVLEFFFVAGEEDQVGFLFGETFGDGGSDAYTKICSVSLLLLDRTNFLPIEAPVMSTFWPVSDIPAGATGMWERVKEMGRWLVYYTQRPSPSAIL
jgi:hypothetical protein